MLVSNPSILGPENPMAPSIVGSSVGLRKTTFLSSSSSVLRRTHLRRKKEMASKMISMLPLARRGLGIRRFASQATATAAKVSVPLVRLFSRSG